MVYAKQVYKVLREVAEKNKRIKKEYMYNSKKFSKEIEFILNLYK
ncbi:hypothetical protein ES705_40538 [subsurface metagenome]